MRGIIKSYLPQKQYGFITGDDGRDYFFHSNDVNSQVNKTDITDGLSVKFDGIPTPKGYQAKTVEFETNPQDLKYTLPVEVLISKGHSVPGWSILESSQWILSETSRDTIDECRRTLCRKAKKLGANAIVQYEYSKHTGSEAGTGKGVHYYTVHTVSGKAVNVGKRSIDGKFNQADFSKLNSSIARFLEASKKSQKVWAIGSFVVTLLFLIVAIQQFILPLLIAAGVAAFVYFKMKCGWIRQAPSMQ